MDLKTVVVGLSGGIDSAVTAYLLQKQKKYRIIALFMKNWDEYVNLEFNDSQYKSDQVSQGCTSKEDFEVAKSVAEKLQIPIYEVNFVDEYWKLVFEKTIDIYKSGNTPNPDILCNRFIKFDLFYKYAKQQFNCDYLATGHYAKKIKDRHGNYNLYLSKDKNKDQTYFLCQIDKDVLKNVLFPLGNYTKQQVREIAKKAGLPNYDRKDSTGICFIGERKFKPFLNNYITFNKGQILEAGSNKLLGEHDGISFYTLGQRKGLNLGDLGAAYIVVGKDKEKNILYVSKIDESTKFLTSHSLVFKTNRWINDAPPTNTELLFRFRHRQDLVKGKISMIEKDWYKAEYPDGSVGVTPGQYIVVYSKGNLCYGGGEIVNID